LHELSSNCLQVYVQAPGPAQIQAFIDQAEDLYQVDQEAEVLIEQDIKIGCPATLSPQFVFVQLRLSYKVKL